MTGKCKLPDIRLDKIKTPVVLKVGGAEIEYENGAAVANAGFDKMYLFESITVEGNRIIAEVVENNRYGKVYWTDRQVSMFDGDEE
ncbi:MAG: hypothetical protein HFH59_08570 [Lachnospiraceae bacterium]|nr:hypothetical protein [Lachnospiraceae bacterium]